MINNSTPLQIAIDGPVGAGKGDIADRIAKKFSLLYINTGAMYRMLALSCIEKGVDRKNEKEVLKLLQKTKIDLRPPKEGSDKTFIGLLDNRDVTDRLLDPDVSQGSSDVATLPEVRKHMVEMQKNMAKGKRVVMEGRDISLRVLPEAQLKIYLTASLRERAERRQKQWLLKGITKTPDEVVEETRIRDKQDMERQTDPLQKLPDAWELDTTGMTQDEVIEEIGRELKRRNLI